MRAAEKARPRGASFSPSLSSVSLDMVLVQPARFFLMWAVKEKNAQQS